MKQFEGAKVNVLGELYVWMRNDFSESIYADNLELSAYPVTRLSSSMQLCYVDRYGGMGAKTALRLARACALPAEVMKCST